MADNDPPQPKEGGFYEKVSSAQPPVPRQPAKPLNPADIMPPKKDPRPPGIFGPTPASQLPPADFDFINKQSAKPPKRKFSSIISGIPKPLLIGGGLFIVLVLIIVGGSVLSNRSGANNKKLVDIAAQSQEILRVSRAYQVQLKNPAAVNLAATTQVTLNSSQSEMLNYFKKLKVKYKSQDLLAHVDKKTDAQLSTAAQNNVLDAAYENYLKATLTKYRASLNAVYKTSGPNMKKILKTAYNTASTILSSQELSKPGNT